MRKLLLVSFLFAIVFNARSQDKIYYGDCQNGFGVKVAADKTTIYGNFQNGLLNGYALVVMPDGSMYSGQYKDNVCWGKGIMLYNQGFVYMGDYVKNAQHGTGTMFAVSRQIIDGTWSNNQPAQVNKIETKNQNSPCILGDCDKGPGHTFKDVTSFACITSDLILERKPGGYQYFGPRKGEGNMTIVTKDWIYVGMGKDREPNGTGAKVWMSGKKYEVGNWGTIEIGKEKTTIFWEKDKTCPVQVNTLSQFKLPLSESLNNLALSNDGKKVVYLTDNSAFGCYDITTKKNSTLSGADKVKRIAISGDGLKGAYCTENQIKIFDLVNAKLLRTHNDTVLNTNFIFSPNGQHLIYSVDSTYIGFMFVRGTKEKAKVLDIKTGRIIKDFETGSTSLNWGRNLCGDKYNYYDCPYVFNSKGNLYSFSTLGIDIFDYLSGKEIDYGYDTTRFKYETSCNIQRFTVSPTGNRIALLRDYGLRIFKVVDGNSITWTPDGYFPEMTEYGLVTKGFIGEDVQDTKIRSINYTADGKGLLANTSDDLIIVDLRFKTPGDPYYKSPGRIFYTIPFNTWNNMFGVTADRSKFYLRTDDGEIYIYEVKLN